VGARAASGVTLARPRLETPRTPKKSSTTRRRLKCGIVSGEIVTEERRDSRPPTAALRERADDKANERAVTSDK